MLYETHFLISLCVTWLVEVPLLVLLVRFVAGGRACSPTRIAGTGLLASALTLPYLWFVLPAFVDAAYWPLAGELLAVAAEAAVFFLLLRVKPAAAVLLSLALNAASFALGMWLW